MLTSCCECWELLMIKDGKFEKDSVTCVPCWEKSKKKKGEMTEMEALQVLIYRTCDFIKNDFQYYYKKSEYQEKDIDRAKEAVKIIWEKFEGRKMNRGDRVHCFGLREKEKGKK